MQDSIKIDIPDDIVVDDDDVLASCPRRSSQTNDPVPLAPITTTVIFDNRFSVQAASKLGRGQRLRRAEGAGPGQAVQP